MKIRFAINAPTRLDEAGTADSEPTPPQRGCRAGDPGTASPARRGTRGRAGGRARSVIPGPPTRGLCALGWASGGRRSWDTRACFARRRHQSVEAAIITAKSREAAGERTTPQNVPELLLDEAGQAFFVGGSGPAEAGRHVRLHQCCRGVSPDTEIRREGRSVGRLHRRSRLSDLAAHVRAS